MRFQDSTKILDSILSSQRSPSITLGLGFHETVKGEYSSQACARIFKDNNTKSETPIKEIRIQPKLESNKDEFSKEIIAPNNINFN